MDLADKLTEMFFSVLPSIIVGLIFVLGAFAAVFLARRVVRKMQFGDDSRKRIQQAWAEVEQHVADGDETHLRMAIIKADAVLDMALQAKMFPGRSLNDRLNFAIHKYRNLKKVRWAHGLRNTLAHEPMKQLTRRDGTAAIASFRSALKELGAL
jgi:hypothetical protein